MDVVVLALLVLALVAPALAFAVWPLLRQRPAGAGDAGEAERAALETEKHVALRALQDLELERQAGHVGDEDYAESRARYEARAAELLRRLDALGAPGAPPASARPAPGPWTRRPAVLGATGGGLLAFGVLLGVLVSRYTAPAPPAAGGMPTDRTAMTGVPGPAPDPAAAPPTRPGDGAPGPVPREVLEGMLRAAHASLDAGRYQEAIAAYKAVLRRDPTNVDAITHLGVILATAGHHAEALEAFDRALAIDPDYAHALWDKAGVLEAVGDLAGAVATLERFARVVPRGPDHERAQARLREARARLPGAPARPSNP
jgi:tetratricopeptide (TPR) repeat protein